MKAEEFLSDDFLKQFKNGKQLNDFLGQIQKRAIEKMLEGELDGHLGYEKNEQSDSQNARNGYGKKKIKTSYGEAEIKVPRDRNASFNPMIVPKRESMVEGIEEVIVSLYAKGMSVSDIEDQIRDVYKFEVSTATISRILSDEAGISIQRLQGVSAFLKRDFRISFTYHITIAPCDWRKGIR